MSKKNQLKSMTTGFIKSKDYPLGQLGGCNNAGLYQSANQTGGAILPALAAIYAGLKAVRPFGKSKKALEENVGEKGKQSTAYKIAHKIASIGDSFGIGQSAHIMGPITYAKKTSQPILGKGKKKQKGRGKQKKTRKHRK